MSTSVASVVNHFPSAENGFTTTTSGSVSSGATTVGLNSVAGYTNGEVVVFVIDPSDASKKQTFTGTIDTSGVQVTDVVWTAGTNQTHSAGATVVDYATATHISMITKGLLAAGLTQAGGMGTIAPVTLSVSGASTLTGALTIKSYDGWITPTYTPVYASASSITVTGTDATAQFPVGTKVSLNQSGTKYFYVTSSSFSTDTTINLTGGSDYTVANAAISSFKYSYDSTPQGFPSGFNYSPTLSGRFTDGDWTKACFFSMVGKDVFFRISLIATDATPMAGGTAEAIFTLPVTSISYPGVVGTQRIGSGILNDLATLTTEATVEWATTATAYIRCVTVAGSYADNAACSSTVPFTWATGDEIYVQGVYRAA